MNSRNRNNVKLLAAVIGGSAVVTMGALTMSVHQQQAGPDNVAAKGMTLGATTSQTVAPATVEATSMAVPAIKGTASFKASAP